jgi:hypothetical protein
VLCLLTRNLTLKPPPPSSLNPIWPARCKLKNGWCDESSTPYHRARSRSGSVFMFWCSVFLVFTSPFCPFRPPSCSCWEWNPDLPLFRAASAVSLIGFRWLWCFGGVSFSWSRTPPDFGVGIFGYGVLAASGCMFWVFRAGFWGWVLQLLFGVVVFV